MNLSPLADLQAVSSYLSRIGATFTSVFRASRSETVGRYEKEIHWVRFNRSGEVFYSSAEVAPTGAEQEAIAAQVAGADLPRQVRLSAVPKTGLPDPVMQADSEDLYEFWNRSGELVMLQVRVAKPDGDKRYVPWTYWSDGLWRAAEPEDQLPIWGANEARASSRVFIHEGAKAARAAKRIASDPSHPFHDIFATGAHVGWIGGAHAANRADWQQLKASEPKDVIVVPDNDAPGRFALPTISQKFSCPVRALVYDSDWPEAWDLADPIPEDMYRDGIYTGPTFEEMLAPADWATDQFPPQTGTRMVNRIREGFAARWIRIDSLQRYAHIDFPTTTYNAEQFNNRVAPFSHSQNTAQLLANVNHQRVSAPTFSPAKPQRLIRQNGEIQLNQYVDRRIAPVEGIDTSLWWEFFEYLFPVEEERYQMRRWLSTLYGRPDIRMGYGVLALSVKQGVGKSTIGTVAAQMVGPSQCAFPGDTMITQSDFNGWLVNKRLVVVHEIYAGQNWRAYNKLKTLITDAEIEANIKHQATYTMPNWTHYYCCSNSMEALRIERDDRRWFVPKLPETMWPVKKYNALWNWIRSGGLHGLAKDLLEWNDWVDHGEFAPDSESKADLIEASRPEEETLLGLMMENLGKDEGLIAQDVWMWLRKEVSGKVFISPERASRVVKQMGYGMSVRRVSHEGHDHKQRILALSQEVADSLSGTTLQERASLILSPENVFSRGSAM